jgi:hypothetical protein
MNTNITTPPIKTGEDEKFIYFIACFQGKQVKIILDKISNKVWFCADDTTKIPGLGIQ